MDRRIVLAILLMMVIAIVPAALFKQPPAPRPVGVDSTSVAVPPPQTATPLPAVEPLDTVGPADTVRVTSSLYTYEFSTRGGRMIAARLHAYRSMVPADKGADVQLLRPGSDLLALTLVTGRDSLSLADWTFTPSTSSLAVTDGPAILTMTAERSGVRVMMTYTFHPQSYRLDVTGQVDGFGPNGGVMAVGLGPGLRNADSDSVEHLRTLGVVTKANDTHNTSISSLKLGEPKALSGPFDWVAVKSKYFVTGLFAYDTLSTGPGSIGGVQLVATDSLRSKPGAARIQATLPVPGAGQVSFALYAGPMEHDRLKAMGRDFDDVNPYGWPGLRTLIRPVAVGARWLLVWMHDNLALSYGAVLIIFGVMVRVLLWPLNQKAMRSSMAMQAVQPLIKELQDKYKKDPQKLQQEMFKLYKEHHVNPMGGCWPMLLPMPILFALFFVFQNTIELRGAPFLWISDLSRADPFYVIPALMGLSMFVVSKIGQAGLPSNPQSKMLLYIMPAMMTFLFANFASGLNLYYACQNIASIPQQMLLARERKRRNPPVLPPPAPKSKGGGGAG